MRCLAVAVALAVPLAGCTQDGPAARPTPSAPAPTESAVSPGSDADLPLPTTAPVPPVEGVPAARAEALRAELSSVWGITFTAEADRLRGSGADTASGIRFGVQGRATGSSIRGYACTATPSSGTFAPPVVADGDSEPAPEVLAAMETALGFLQTCANSSAADPDRATVWVRAVAQQVLAGTPAQRRIGGVLFRFERSGGGLRLAVGSV